MLVNLMIELAKPGEHWNLVEGCDYYLRHEWDEGDIEGNPSDACIDAAKAIDALVRKTGLLGTWLSLYREGEFLVLSVPDTRSGDLEVRIKKDD